MKTEKSEFSHILSFEQLRSRQSLTIEANAEERAALARRFALLSLDKLTAVLELSRDEKGVHLTGHLEASAKQSCIASGQPIDANLNEKIALDFRPLEEQENTPDAEIELAEKECDVIFHDGLSIDLGEAVAQSFALALDPYPRSADAAAALKKAGVKSEEEEREESGPFAALAALKDKP